MGFTVAEPVEIPALGLSLANCYVTVHATYSHNKGGDSGYYLHACWMMYAKNAPGLKPIRTESVKVKLDVLSNDPLTAIYAAIKQQYFADKTCTDC